MSRNRKKIKKNQMPVKSISPVPSMVNILIHEVEQSDSRGNSDNNQQNSDGTNIDSKSDFDHANYRRDLETLLKYAYDEYKHIGLERQRNQLTYIRHYLWFAALVVGTGSPLFWYLKNPIQGVFCISQEPGVLFFLTCFACIILALVVLALGIDALRGREMTHLPFGSFMDHAHTAYECALEGMLKPTMLTTLIASIDNANAAHIPKIHTVGIKLRWMSRILLTSLICGIIAVTSRVNF